MKQLSLSQKNNAVKRITNGEKVAHIAKELGISRTIVYKWIKLYKTSGPRAKSSKLTSHIKKGKAHWKTFDNAIERKILLALVKNPNQSITAIAQSLSISRNGVWRVALRHDLNTQIKRVNYNYRSSGNLIPETKLQDKIIAIRRRQSGETVTQICKDFHISRTIFYRWFKQYATSSNQASALQSKHVSGASHWKSIPDAEAAILKVVQTNPELSAQKISVLLNEQHGYKFIGHSLVHTILKNKNLSTKAKRVLYAESLAESGRKFTPVIVNQKPITTKHSFVSFLAPPSNFSKKKLFALYSSVTFLVGIILLTIVKTITQTSGILDSIGMFFAIVSLLFGMFFLVYSFKYYLTIWLVLSYSRQEDKRAPIGWKSMLSQIFGIEIQVEVEGEEQKKLPLSSATGMHADVSNVRLEREPFVSVHVSIYNEKRVIDRLLTACTSFDYSNYEVIIADDSTDETYDLIKKWGHHPRVKISHRDTRDGYKGQALQQALSVTDPRAEFIVVFDADFIPYPDSLTQFLKYMQQSVGSLDKAALAGTNIASVQGYQWHVLNKSENWITRGIRTEYAGSYVMERSAEEIYHGLKQISGSVYMIRRDVLTELGWGRSITEDFQLTLRLYEAGYKVVYTPYIQAPAEAASTIKRLIRQRMRWSEGHSFNVKLMFTKMFTSPHLTRAEKLEFAYLIPYYLQAAFFIIGTLAWFLAETVFQVRLPFWTEVWGWSLVLTNLFALPLMNMVGLFMEESEEKDYVGLLSFVALTYIVAPFQAYAAIKGFIEKEEGPWFRTPKTGRITDTFLPNKFYGLVKGLFGKGSHSSATSHDVATSDIKTYAALATAHNTFNGFFIKKKKARYLGNAMLGGLLILMTLVSAFAPYIPATKQVYASEQKIATVDHVEKANSEEKKDASDNLNSNKGSDLLRNFQTQEITTPRIVTKTTKGDKQVSFVFHKDPRVRIILDKHEIEFSAQTIAGKAVKPSEATIYKDQEVIYHNILKDVDLKYSIGNDMISEEFILKTPEAVKYFTNTKTKISSQMRTVDVKVVSIDKSTFGLYGKDNKELFKFSSAFAKDAKGEVTNDISTTLEKAKTGYTISKILQPEALTWLQDGKRVFPIAIDPSVVVSGGIVSSETQYGGLQRKVAFVNGNWYAFYNDGTDVFYKKSSDGVSWGSAVDMDTGDADNYNPSISVSGNMIMAFWIDDSGDTIEGRRIDTGNSDAQGTLCATSDQGTIGSTFMTTVAAYSTTEAVIAYSDTGADTEVDMYRLTGLNGSCSQTDIGVGNVWFGTGITASDRPVLVPISSTRIGMVFQDGALYYSEYNPAANDWTLDDLQIAAVTDNVYSVTTDGTTFWVLSVSGTTSTNLYSCCTTGFTTVNGDSDTGGTGNDNVSDVDIYCPTATDCKLVYTDDVDTASPRLQFVDCDDATCSTGTNTNIDADIGASGDEAGASLYCVSATDCKIAYVDNQSTSSPDLYMIDCGNATCSSFSFGTVDSDPGTNTMNFHTDIDCVGGGTDCKIMYNLEITGNYYMEFVDCGNATCSTANYFALYTNGGNENKFSLVCPSATNCKVFAHDPVNSKTVFMDCGNATCSSGNTFTDVLTSVTATTGHVPVSMACPSSTDCKLVFGDPTTANFYFVDCANETCTSTGRTITTIDDDGGALANLGPSTSLYCVSATDCKVTYVGILSSGSEQVYFVDCNDAVCSVGYVVPLPNTRFKAALACPATDDCKFVSMAGTSATAPSLQFADCSSANCYPTSTTLTSPWTGQTNITTATLSYDSTNSDLVASILKDSTNQAYFKTSDAASISWGTEYSYGFTAGSLSDISSPMTGAGSSQMGVVTRQGTNFEFSTLPENPWILVSGFPLLLYFMIRRRKRVSS